MGTPKGAEKALYLAARHSGPSGSSIGEGYGGRDEFDDGAALEAPENSGKASHGWIHLLCIAALQRRRAAERAQRRLLARRLPDRMGITTTIVKPKPKPAPKSAKPPPKHLRTTQSGRNRGQRGGGKAEWKFFSQWPSETLFRETLVKNSVFREFFLSSVPLGFAQTMQALANFCIG